MNLNPGEVWLANLGLAAKTRPAIIVSRYDDNPPRSLAVYVPLITQNRGSIYKVALPSFNIHRHDYRNQQIQLSHLL